MLQVHNWWTDRSRSGGGVQHYKGLNSAFIMKNIEKWGATLFGSPLSAAGGATLFRPACLKGVQHYWGVFIVWCCFFVWVAYRWDRHFFGPDLSACTLNHPGPKDKILIPSGFWHCPENCKMLCLGNPLFYNKNKHRKFVNPDLMLVTKQLFFLAKKKKVESYAGIAFPFLQSVVSTRFIKYIGNRANIFEE